jgi:phosphoribosylaminoimidazolecarboxamide formyltransferase/IMP cyclohydrolase
MSERAILSLTNKEGSEKFCTELIRRGFSLVSTGGTAKRLRDAGLTVTDVAEVTGFPEMMDGRLKTLHPNIHGGILARRDVLDDMQVADAHGIDMISIVVVNFYAFADEAAKPDVTFDDLVEKIDIGGPSLVRGAAKNFRHVIVLVDPADYSEALRELDQDGGPSLAFRLRMMKKAFDLTASYDVGIRHALAEFDVDATTGAIVRLPDTSS